MNKKKQFLLALLVIVICYAASFVVSYMSLKSVISDNAKQVTQIISERIYDAINNELTKPIAVSLTMALMTMATSLRWRASRWWVPV